MNILSKSLLVAIIIISIQDAALRIAAVGKVIRLFKKGLSTITLLYNKFKSMFVLFIKNNRGILLNIREAFDLLSCLVLFNKITKGTKWDFIIRTVSKHENGLFGIDKLFKNSLGSEWVSHVFEMGKVQSQNNGNVYLPITDSIRDLRDGYKGKLHDGLVFDTSSGSIVSKIEFKSKLNAYFLKSNLNKLSQDYGSLDLDRIDLCCLNAQSFKKTVLSVNQFDHHLVPFKFNPVDFSTVFTELNNDSYSNNIDEIISNQIALKPDLMDVWSHLLLDPSFFPIK